MIDRILEHEEGVRVVCLKNVTINEEFFCGMPQDELVMPWSLIIEAMAQTSGLLMKRDCGIVFFAGMKGMRIHGPVVPGDVLQITSVKRGTIGPVTSFKAVAEVNGSAKLDGEILLVEIDKVPEEQLKI
jgi:3-hydroxymyristoyl/3-hydroxydecanoyl-(acyl carrier protein) dehydratase